MMKDLLVEKEVLGQMIDGVYAAYLNQAIKNQDKNNESRSQNILSLRQKVRDANTEEELEAIEEKLKRYSRGIWDK